MTDIISINNIKNIHKFICEICDFKCYKKGDYTRHLSSIKHQTVTNDFEKSAKSYSCVCGKEYKHRQNLHAHKKTCQTLIQNETTNKMIELLQQNNELKEIIYILQNKVKEPTTK
jgi:hypothetical protein